MPSEPLYPARDLYAEIDRQNQLITGFADALRQLTVENHKLQEERDYLRRWAGCEPDCDGYCVGCVAEANPNGLRTSPPA